MTIKEKLCEPLGKFYIETSKELEQIADEYAIELLEWLSNEKSKFAILYGNQEERFATIEEDYTSKQLLEIFKKEKGL